MQARSSVQRNGGYSRPAEAGHPGLAAAARPAGLPPEGARRRVWMPAVAEVGQSGIHFHDLRHAGNTLTADEGASLRELMDRIGHSSTRAALIYLHSSDERQRKLADAVGERARAALGKTGIASGTEVARSPGQMP